MNKLNKLVATTFPQIQDEWNKEDFQKKLKKIFKKKREVKPEDVQGEKKHTSYIRYCISERPNTKKMYPNLAAKEITTQLGKQWNQAKLERPEELKRLFGYQPAVKEEETQKPPVVAAAPKPKQRTKK